MKARKGAIVATAARAPKADGQRAMLAKRGYLRISDAAEKTGREVGYIHRAIKSGRLDLRKGHALRVDYLWFVYEPALAEMVGAQAAAVMGLRASGWPPPLLPKSAPS